MASRLEMVMAEDTFEKDESAKLRQQADDMYVLKVTLDSRGWKKIIAEYLDKRLTLERFLQTKNTQERHEIYGALNELQEFINFINTKVKDGEKAVLKLNQREDNKRNE